MVPGTRTGEGGSSDGVRGSADTWFDDAYHRLDQVLKTWPSEGA